MTPPPRNPLGQALGAVLALLAVVGAFLFGLVALGFIVAFALVLGAVMWVRVWWLTRTGKIKPVAANPQKPPSDRGKGGNTLDAEYEVISSEPDRD